MIVFKGGEGGEEVDLEAARVESACAMLEPASGPRPLLARIKCCRGRCEERNLINGCWTVEPNALSDKSTVCRFG